MSNFMFDSRKSQLSIILGETNFPQWELLLYMVFRMKRFSAFVIPSVVLLVAVWGNACTSVSTVKESDAIDRWGSLNFGSVKILEINNRSDFSRLSNPSGYFYDDYIPLTDTTTLPVLVHANTDGILLDSTLRDAIMTFKNVQQDDKGITFTLIPEEHLLTVYASLIKHYGKPTIIKDIVKSDKLPTSALWVKDKHTVEFILDKPRKRMGQLFYGARDWDELKNGYKQPSITFKLTNYHQYIRNLELKQPKNLSIDQILSVSFDPIRFHDNRPFESSSVITAYVSLYVVERIDGRNGGENFIGSLKKIVSSVNFDLVIRSKDDSSELFRLKNQTINFAEPLGPGKYFFAPVSDAGYTFKFEPRVNTSGYYKLKQSYGKWGQYVAIAEFNSLKYSDGTVESELQQ